MNNRHICCEEPDDCCCRLWSPSITKCTVCPPVNCVSGYASSLGDIDCSNQTIRNSCCGCSECNCPVVEEICVPCF